MASTHGINIAGLEYGYTENTQNTYNYFAAKGFKTVRIPFKWETLQPDLNAPLDESYAAQIDQEVEMAGNAGLKAILDLHNYGRRDVLGVGGFTADFSTSSDPMFTSQYNHTISDGRLVQNEWDRVFAGSKRNTVSASTYLKASGDFRITANGGADTWRGLWFEFLRIDDNNRYYAIISNLGSTWELRKVVNGTETVLASGSQAFALNTIYTLELDVNVSAADRLTFKINGVQTAQVSHDSALSSGQVGIFGNGVQWDVDAFTLNVDGDTTTGRSSSGSQVRLGEALLPTTAFADVWSRIASRYHNNATVYGYDLMNEMHDMPVPATASTYKTTATNTLAQQAAYDAITAIDTSHRIYVQPDHWSGAQTFLSQYGSNPEPWINDPYNLVVYSFHYYFDADHSGSYPSGYQSLSLDNIYPDVEPVLKWAQERGVRRHIGEYGTPSDDTRWLTVLTRFLDLCTFYQVDTNYWGAGDSYSSITTIQPTDNWSTDRLQMQALSPYVSSQVTTPTAATNIISGYGKTEASRYQYLLYINNLLFADITGLCEDRSFAITRNRPDEINFTVDLDKLDDLARRLNTNVQDLLQVGVAEVRVVRNGVVLSAGQLVGWEAELGERRLISIHAKGWLELLKYRLTNNSYTNQTALQIAQNELNTTQARPFGSLGIAIGAYPSPDTTNSYASKVYENKSVYDVLVELSEEQGGFDLEVTWDKKLNIYTQIGIQRPEVLLTYPGNVKDVSLTKDSSRLVNALTVRGQGYGDNQLIVSVSDAASQQLYSIRESTLDFPDVADTAQLTNLANSELSAYKQPLVIHDVVFNGGGVSGTPEVGSFHVGDRIPIVVKTLQLYEDVNRYFTIDKISVSISNEDEEEVTLSFT